MAQSLVRHSTAAQDAPALTLHTASGTALVIPAPVALRAPFLAGLALGATLGAIIAAAVLTAPHPAA